MKYSDVIRRYPVFYFHDFAIIESEDEFHIQYDFEISGLSHFNPDFIVAKPEGKTIYANLRSVREAAFSLGLMELISYWKLTCSPTVIIECGALDKEQIAWWKRLYYNGMAEFFCRNGIQADPDSFMTIQSAGEPITGQIDQRRFYGNLIPVGGGKDSAVSLKLLSGMKDDNHVFILNHVMSAVRSAEAAGYTGENLIIADRSLDSRMLEFNKNGFLNGPTPFAALCAFAATLTAVIYGIQNVCVSNEEPDNDPTVRESLLQRSYSKTYAFECDFKRYADAYITPDVHCFSLLRPLNELQIAGLFSRMKDYFPIVCSCSSGQSKEQWCGHCEKCLFNCVLLSAYLSDETLYAIFGTDMLNDESMQDLFEQLSGLKDEKPDECKGTRDAFNTAAAMSVRRHETEGIALPKLYQYYKTVPYYEYYKDKQVDWTQYNTQNLVPDEYAVLLKNWLEEMQK